MHESAPLRTLALLRAVDDAVAQQCQGTAGEAPLEIVVRVQHDAVVATSPAEPAAIGTAQPPRGNALASRPIAAPLALQRKLPLRRQIEESRPYLVLGEGIEMINGHPLAATIFYGGLTYWVAGYVLAQHGLRGAALAAAQVLLLLGWSAAYLMRSGAARLLLTSVRASRAQVAEPATWARLAEAGRCHHLLARISRALFCVPMPERALLRATAAADAASLAIGGEHIAVLEGSSTASPRCRDEEPLAGGADGSSGVCGVFATPEKARAARKE